MKIKITGGTPHQLVRFGKGTFPDKFRFDKDGNAIIEIDRNAITERIQMRFPEISIDGEAPKQKPKPAPKPAEKPITEPVKQISEKPIEKPATKKTIDYPTNRKELIKLAKEIIETGKIEAFPLNIKSEEIIEKLKGVK